MSVWVVWDGSFCPLPQAQCTARNFWLNSLSTPKTSSSELRMAPVVSAEWDQSEIELGDWKAESRQTAYQLSCVFISSDCEEVDTNWSTKPTVAILGKEKKGTETALFRRSKLKEKLQVAFYHSAVENILTYVHRTLDYKHENTSEGNISAKKTKGCSLPSWKNLFRTCCIHKT